MNTTTPTSQNDLINEFLTDGTSKGLGDLSMMVSHITKAYQRGREEEKSEYSVSWDNAVTGGSWRVQFWRKDKDGKITLLTELNNESDEGGSFDL